ncbi:MAG: amidohydrolase [Acidobacteria bacterium]|nr:MAG: amidohydrolase [Acidobacteriota bacterium]
MRVGFLAEYDALPGLGHACGHNLIAAAAIGAGIAVGRLVDLLGGEILVFGTPAEETIGVQVEFHGKPAHAVAHPDKGINALDAMIQLFIAADHIRRSSRRDVRIPGVILEGGVRPNVVPERAVAQFSIRAPTSPERDEVVARMRRWVESIALASGCSFAFQFTDNPYDEMITNRTLAEIYKGHLASEGVATRDEPREHMGSLDMGNVSFRVPAIHAYVAIVPPDVASHTQTFALATVTQTGKQAALLAAKTLGRTAVDLLCDSGLVARVREEFAAMRAAAKTTRGEGFDAPRDYILDRP